MASAKYQKLRRLAYYLVTPLMWNPGYGKFNSENCVLVMVSSLVLPTGLWPSCPLVKGPPPRVGAVKRRRRRRWRGNGV